MRTRPGSRRSADKSVVRQPQKRDALELERRLMIEAEEGIAADITLRRRRVVGVRAAPGRHHQVQLPEQPRAPRPADGRRSHGQRDRPRLVAAFLVHLRDKGGVGPGTQRKIRTVLSSGLSYAVAMEYVAVNPVMKVPPPELDETHRAYPAGPLGSPGDAAHSRSHGVTSCERWWSIR